ncbi:MAG: hypothetical protein JOZ58_07755 [Acetobacteraceae bacterium]|nr:hypothetical protein [Acetobacteraceae bacterium]
MRISHNVVLSLGQLLNDLGARRAVPIDDDDQVKRPDPVIAPQPCAKIGGDPAGAVRPTAQAEERRD